MHDDLDPAFGHWLAGLVAGEGYFSILKPGGSVQCVFGIDLRADDASVLEEAQRAVGLGAVRYRETATSATASWLVSRKAETAEIVDLFNRFPLRAKKARDFERWREAVLLWQTKDPRAYFRRNYKRGDAHHRAKFSEEDIAAMGVAWRSGETQTSIAARFGTSQDYVSKLLNGLARVTGERVRAAPPKDPAESRMLELRDQLMAQRAYVEPTRKDR